MHYACRRRCTSYEQTANLQVTADNAPRIGVAFGSGIGGLSSIEDGHTTTILKQEGPNKISPFFVPGSIINMAAGLLAIRLWFKRPQHCRVPPLVPPQPIVLVWQHV
jgi:3-oxoacyl-(acyl-carrier-protein) synthase